MKSAYRVHNAFSHEEILHLVHLNQVQDLSQGDPWSMNKLQATHFLQAEPEIRKLAMEANAEFKIASEDAMDTFCITKRVESIVQTLLVNGLILETPTDEVMQQVLYFIN